MKNKLKVIEQGPGTSSKFEDAVNDFLANEVEQNEWDVEGMEFTADKDGRQTCNIWLKSK